MDTLPNDLITKKTRQKREKKDEKKIKKNLICYKLIRQDHVENIKYNRQIL